MLTQIIKFKSNIFLEIHLPADKKLHLALQSKWELKSPVHKERGFC
jgi:hypothetical protein